MTHLDDSVARMAKAVNELQAAITRLEHPNRVKDYIRDVERWCNHSRRNADSWCEQRRRQTETF